MYYVQKDMEISAAHWLELDYPSKCSALHGHNWHVSVHCRAERLDRNGMVCDFTVIKRKVMDKLDHKNISEVLPFNPTAENIARWIKEQVGETCYKVVVRESDGNTAVYEVD